MTPLPTPLERSVPSGAAGLPRYAAEWVALGVCAVWIFALLFATWPAPLYPDFNSNSPIDSAFFGYAGELIRTGARPYLDFWDHKPPLIFLVNAAGLMLSGGRVWGIWLVNLFMFLTAVVLGCLTLRRSFGTWGTVLGTTYFAFSLPLALPLNLTEGYVLPLQWAAAFLLTRSELSRFARPALLGLMIGILSAFAFFLRANLIGAGLSVMLALSVVLLSERRFQAWLRFVAGTAAGAVSVAAVVLLYLWSLGVLEAFSDQVFHYNVVYSAASWGMRVRAAIYVLGTASAFGSLILPAAGWAFAAYRLWSSRHRSLQAPLFFGLIWLPVEVALASVSGREYAHYTAPLFAPLAFLAAIFAAEIAASLQEGDANAGAVPARYAIGALAAGIVLLPLAQVLRDLRDSDLQGMRRDQIGAASAYIASHTPPNAHVLVWGHAADVYFLSRRRPASRFIYALPLLTPGYADTALIRGFLDELRAAQPPLILDATAGQRPADNLVPSLATWNPHWRYPATGAAPWWTMSSSLKAFYDYIGEQYTIVDSVGPQRWTVYRRTDTAR